MCNQTRQKLKKNMYIPSEPFIYRNKPLVMFEYHKGLVIMSMCACIYTYIYTIYAQVMKAPKRLMKNPSLEQLRTKIAKAKIGELLVLRSREHIC